MDLRRQQRESYSAFHAAGSRVSEVVLSTGTETGLRAPYFNVSENASIHRKHSEDLYNAMDIRFEVRLAG